MSNLFEIFLKTINPPFSSTLSLFLKSEMLTKKWTHWKFVFSQFTIIILFLFFRYDWRICCRTYFGILKKLGNSLFYFISCVDIRCCCLCFVWVGTKNRKQINYFLSYWKIQTIYNFWFYKSFNNYFNIYNKFC